MIIPKPVTGKRNRTRVIGLESPGSSIWAGVWPRFHQSMAVWRSVDIKMEAKFYWKRERIGYWVAKHWWLLQRSSPCNWGGNSCWDQIVCSGCFELSSLISRWSPTMMLIFLIIIAAGECELEGIVLRPRFVKCLPQSHTIN